MTELYFLRHGERIDHALKKDPQATPLLDDYKSYDPSLATSAIPQLKSVVDDICATTEAFQDQESSLRKNVYIHFSPYLRCCQSADIVITELKSKFAEKFGNYKVRFQLLGDFALSEWVHPNMENKPPFVDSNDAYNMYTPNLKTLKNKNACSNFRPTVTLGQYNGPNLSFKEYQSRCKEYFQKLLATYDKPLYIKNKDIIIVISHGYMINNFMSFFTSHPIFQEIPEAKINFAKRVKKEELSIADDNDDDDDDDEFNPANYTWRMEKDALGLSQESDSGDMTLNLESDIVYYKTNFIKKNDLLEKPKEQEQQQQRQQQQQQQNSSLSSSVQRRIPQEYKPRASFKIESTSASHSINGKPPTMHNYLCPAAKNWIPGQKHFKIKADFKEKIINDESFRRNFSITNPPLKQISPDVSPNSAPSNYNSVIDLSKIMSNESLQPIKLKYSNTSDIPIHKINSRVNSQVNLNQGYKQTPPPSSSSASAENSMTDLPKYVSFLQNRHRSSSNPNAPVVIAPFTKDSYFPQVINRVKSNDSEMSIDLPSDQSCDELDIIDEKSEPSFTSAASAAPRASPLDTLNRARSLNKKTVNNPLLVSYQKRSQQNFSTMLSKLPYSSGSAAAASASNEEQERSAVDGNEADNDDDDEEEDRRGEEDDDDDDDKGSDSSTDVSSEEQNFSLKFRNRSYSDQQKGHRSRGGTSKQDAYKRKTLADEKNKQTLETFPNYSRTSKPETKKGEPMFYNFETDDSDLEDDSYKSASHYKGSESTRSKDDYMWFGGNRN
ncbi:hypothetical protein KGF56_002868 [Candida oxycetoniae]|uniref:Uncharacterized protein n=1 Tax=Candida oxycetoniae TaxID=497107 RepID=A0AAI9WXR7_9ASCO|nr:uncharacterized protein KGF56_002868 [Candida oxycetoniae]KAI3404348.2 hypothetical protein KGF56_002868 [Candida oxycetoniae]